MSQSACPALRPSSNGGRGSVRISASDPELPSKFVPTNGRSAQKAVVPPHSGALPGERYEYCEWRLRRVGVDYHVDIDAHYYSVPYRFARAEVEARLTARGVEIFHTGERLAVHLRASGNRKHTTVPEHIRSAHRRYAGWTIERIREDYHLQASEHARHTRLRAAKLGCPLFGHASRGVLNLLQNLLHFGGGEGA